MEAGATYIGVATFVLPNLTVIPAGNINWHVPIDDTHHWKYIIRFDRDKPIDREKCLQDRMISTTSDYKPIANKANRYLQDRAAMKQTIYSGISPKHFQSQDLCPIEGAGALQDRTREHLVANDIPIIVARKLLSKAIQDLQKKAWSRAMSRANRSRTNSRKLSHSSARYPNRKLIASIATSWRVGIRVGRPASASKWSCCRCYV